MGILGQLASFVLAGITVINVFSVSSLTNHPQVLGVLQTTQEITDQGLFMYVDKNQALPVGYVPNDLVSLKELGYPSQFVSEKIYKSLVQLFNDSRQIGMHLTVVSAFRSFQTQENLFNQYAAIYSEGQANTFSARPGYSEHQLGTVIDFGTGRGSDLSENFANEPEGQWLAQNSYKYGFILSYPKDKVAQTGYIYEPWHFRYVGVTAATRIYENNWLLADYSQYLLKEKMKNFMYSVLSSGVGGFPR